MSRQAGMKQASLRQLGGVVVIEELIEANKQLNDPSLETNKKINILKCLKKKKPAKELLKSTGIGKTVHYLSKDKNPEVAAVATEVYQFWKSHVLHILHRKPIEVESDLETKKGRASARKIINLSLENSALAEEIEIHVFNKCKKIMNSTYNRVVRKIHFTMKSNEHLRKEITGFQCDIKGFVAEMYEQVAKARHVSP